MRIASPFQLTWTLLGSAMLLAGIARGQASQGMAACEQATWSGTSYTGNACFGWRLAIGGDTALVGVPDDKLTLTSPAEVHVFERSSGIWSYRRKLPSPGVKWDDGFGVGVAVEGNTAAVGVPGYDIKVMDGGAVFIFERWSGVWRRQAILMANDAHVQGWFGSSVALSGSRLVAGSYGLPPNPPGGAYVFVKVGTGWIQEAKLTGSPGSGYTDFGSSVDIDGDTVVVGDSLDSTIGPYVGAAYVFVRSATGWSQQAKLFASPFGGSFGFSVAVDGNTVAVGAPRSFTSGPTSGSVFVFERAGSIWTQTAVLTPKNAAVDDYCGYSVSIEGDTIVAGAPGIGTNEGSAHLFFRTGSTWTELELKPPVPAMGGTDGDLGASTAISGDTALIGEPRAGLAHVYLLHQALINYCTPKPNSLGCLPAMSFIGCPSAAAQTGFRIQATNVRNNKPGLLLYGTNGRTSVPFLGGTLCAATPVSKTPVVYSGGRPPPFNSCTGVFDIDMAAFASGLLGGTPRPELKLVGTVINCQWWGRDFGSSYSVTLSDALEYTVIP